MDGKNDDPNGCPDTVIGDCEPACARCGRDMGGGVERQRYSGDGVWRRRWVGPWVEEPTG